MRTEIEQAISRLESDEFIGPDVRLLIDELRRLDRPKRKPGEPRPKIPRARDVIMDTFATIEGVANLSEVAPSSWCRYAKCKKELLEMCPAVTPQEMLRRASAYRKEWKGATISADALVKWWGRFSGKSPATSQSEIQLGENLR